MIFINSHKIKQDFGGSVVNNIRIIRLSHGMGKMELIKQIQVLGVPLIREALVKIERGTQYIRLIRLIAIKDISKNNLR